jgi:hypothetical protein
MKVCNPVVHGRLIGGEGDYDRLKGEAIRMHDTSSSVSYRIEKKAQCWLAHPDFLTEKNFLPTFQHENHYIAFPPIPCNVLPPLFVLTLCVHEEAQRP